MALRQIDEGSERVDDSLFLQGRIHLEQSNWSQALGFSEIENKSC